VRAAQDEAISEGARGDPPVVSAGKTKPGATAGLEGRNNAAVADAYLIGRYLNFWPPTEASYINPPFAFVKMARPSV